MSNYVSMQMEMICKFNWLATKIDANKYIYLVIPHATYKLKTGDLGY